MTEVFNAEECKPLRRLHIAYQRIVTTQHLVGFAN